MEEILKKLNIAQARFVVIGGQAMMQHGMPRFTLDWDIFVPPFDKENFAKINEALQDDLDMEQKHTIIGIKSDAGANETEHSFRVRQ